VQLECVTPREVAASRIAGRAGDTSDATAAIATRLAAMWSPWPEATAVDTNSTDGPAGTDPVEQALNAIRSHGPEHVWRPLRPYMLPG
jgi:uncharacterized protein